VVLGGLSGGRVVPEVLDQVKGDRPLAGVDGLEQDGWRPSASTAGSLLVAPPAPVGVSAAKLAGGAAATGAVGAAARCEVVETAR
jgi:hypothetical protein